MRSGNTGQRAEVRVDLVVVADLGVAVAVGGVGELEWDVGLAARRGTAAGRPRAARRSAARRSGRAGTRAGSRAGSARWRPDAPPRRASPSGVPSSRRRSTSRLWSLMNATAIWLVNRCTSLRGSPMSAIPSWLRGHVAAVGREQQLGRVVLGVQVRRADRARAVERPRGWPSARGSCGSGGIGAMRQRRAVGGDVVRHELPEERPHRRDASVGVIAEVDAQVARAAGAAERVQRRLVGLERGQVRRTASGSARRRSGRRPVRAPGSGLGRYARRAGSWTGLRLILARVRDSP